MANKKITQGDYSCKLSPVSGGVLIEENITNTVACNDICIAVIGADTPTKSKAISDMIALAGNLSQKYNLDAFEKMVEALQWAGAFGKNGEVHDKMIIEKCKTAFEACILDK